MAKSEDLIRNLISLPHEYEWLDIKGNWFSKEEIGEYISAISNGAALRGREYGYVIWGVVCQKSSVRMVESLYESRKTSLW